MNKIILISNALGDERRKTKNFPHKTKRTHNFNNNQLRNNIEGTIHPSVIVFFFFSRWYFFVLQFVHFSSTIHSSKFINFIHPSNSTAIHMDVVYMHTTLIRRLPKIQKTMCYDRLTKECAICTHRILVDFGATVPHFGYFISFTLIQSHIFTAIHIHA